MTFWTCSKNAELYINPSVSISARSVNMPLFPGLHILSEMISQVSDVEVRGEVASATIGQVACESGATMDTRTISELRNFTSMKHS